MKKIFIFAAIFTVSIFAVFLAACGNVANTPTAENSNTTVVTSSPATDGNSPTTIESHPTFKVDYRSEPEAIQAGTPTTLVFTVKDKQGAIIKDLQIVHEKPMHLLIVSKDLAEFYHLHPEQQADGAYRVTHTFPNGGEYKLYADFTPQGAVQVVEQIDIKVAGEERARVELVADQRLEKTVDGLKVVMKPRADLKAGQELTLGFQMFDAASGKPATDLQNYLGALAHFVIISQDMKDFVHAHPLEGNSEDSHQHGKMDDMQMDNHSMTEGTKNKQSVSEVFAHTSFPRPGLYKIWAQFQRGNKIIVIPFVVNVSESGKTATTQNTNATNDAVKITVSKNGYEPASVEVKKGQPAKLAFYRADAENCGSEVIFSKLNITKKLPVGETVLVEFTPTDSGEFAFTCGMNMMAGKLIVSGN